MITMAILSFTVIKKLREACKNSGKSFKFKSNKTDINEIDDNKYDDVEFVETDNDECYEQIDVGYEEAEEFTQYLEIE